LRKIHLPVTFDVWKSVSFFEARRMMEVELNPANSDNLAQTASPNAVSLYCMGSLVANQAARAGLTGFARSIESALETLLSGLPHEQQRDALRLSYELALEGEQPAPPHLRLVYSRD